MPDLAPGLNNRPRLCAMIRNPFVNANEMFRLTSALPSFRGGNSGGEYHPKATAGEEQDRVPPLITEPPASADQATIAVQNIPPWVRELNSSRVTRHSRASSIVSTQTKFSTTTLQEDARSIDINVGGQYFRISRDGSRVTADAPPPYAGPDDVVRHRENSASDTASLNSVSQSDWEDEDEDDTDEPEDGATTPTSIFVNHVADQGVRANILDPSEFEMPSPVGYDRLTHRSSSAPLIGSTQTSTARAESEIRSSFEEGRDVLNTPARTAAGRRAASQDVTSTLGGSTLQSSPLRRSNGVHLPRLNTITSGNIPRATHRPQRFRDVSSSGRPLQVRSAGAILGDAPAGDEPRSPDFIGRNARANFPFLHRAATSMNTVPTRNHGSSTGVGSAVDGDVPPNDSNTPLAMDDENDISLHYARMMRTLDAAHRKALHLKEKQVIQLHEKLNEKDIVLRQQLRAKDFIIEDQKKRLNNLEETIDAMVEKARHEVEDLWEARWKDRDFHLRERMRRIEEEAQKTIDRFRAGKAPSAAGSRSPQVSHR